jgi:hypothetical protein
VLYISFDGDDAVRTCHLQDQVAIVRHYHELGESKPPKECIVCCFEIGYLKLLVLGIEVFLSPKGHKKGDMANKGSCCSGDYSVEGSPSRMQH